VDTAKDSDCKRAREACAGIHAGEIGIFDRAYLDFDHLFDLFLREVCWVTRTKGNLNLKVVKKRPCKNKKILADEEVVLGADGAFEGSIPSGCAGCVH
jgi:hypothetical protein